MAAGVENCAEENGVPGSPLVGAFGRQDGRAQKLKGCLDAVRISWIQCDQDRTNGCHALALGRPGVVDRTMKDS